jgi:hypothetical protein
MVSLLWNFYREVVVYHAMDAVVKTQKAPQKTLEGLPKYERTWDTNIMDNNLFSKSRGYTPLAGDMPDKAAAPFPEVELEKPDLNLNGIILNQYGEFIALIQTGGQPPKRVRKGDMFDGILVVDISPREVQLLWNDEEMTLSMKKIKPMPKKKSPPPRRVRK